MVPSSFKSVSSSMIRGVSYDNADETMYVQFTDGSIYRYPDVPEEDYQGLVNASSAGSFFHNNIKGIYDGQRV